MTDPKSISGRNYDNIYYNKLFISSSRAIWNRNKASMLLSQEDRAVFSFMKACLSDESYENITASFAGKRPDLIREIWQSIHDISTYKDAIIRPYDAKRPDMVIGQIDIDIMEYFNIDLGTSILLGLLIDNDDTNGLVLRDSAGEKQGMINNILIWNTRRLEFNQYKLSEKIGWYVTNIFVPYVPETLISAYTGGPLKKLISHPVLDRYDIKIDGIHRLDTCFQICLKYDHKIINIADLAQAKLDALSEQNV